MQTWILGDPEPRLGPDWTFTLAADRLVLEARRPLTGLASGWFDDPGAHVAWPIPDDGFRWTGFSYTQFAMPVDAGPGEAFDFHPTDTLFSPAAVLPLLHRADDGTLELWGPLDGFHHQIVAVRDGEFRWGPHGDLDEVPEGFRLTLGRFRGVGAGEALAAWGAELARTRPRPARVANGPDPLLTRLSYWTDNGAAYWYRTEAGRSIGETLADKLTELDELELPVGVVELDSWFYRHEVSRPITEVGYPSEVPPTGMISWDPRAEVAPDGLADFAERYLGGRPLALHARHIAPASPYVEEGEWWTEFAAIPHDPGFFRRWVEAAASAGATTIEQDWMVMIWFLIRDLRARPERATAWQHGLDRAAAEAGIGLLWCMATPADYLTAAELGQVEVVRTSDDYRYAPDPATLWTWYLTVNAFVAPLGLRPFKDCFFSRPDTDVELGGDAHAEFEALLSALSSGPVGIGDRLGRTDVGIVRRTCGADGRLIRPDTPLVLDDASFFGGPRRGDGLCWARCRSGDHRFVVAVNTAAEVATITDRFGLDGERWVYDWRAGAATRAETIEATLGPRDWGLWVIAPDRTDGGAWIGDPTVYATVSDDRVASRPGDDVVVRGAAGERIRLREVRPGGELVDRTVEIGESGEVLVS